jgi:hypothetical protein
MATRILTPRKIIALFTISFWTLFIWEYVARLNNVEYKPSVGFSFVADICKIKFYQLGEILAWISSFYTLLHFRDLLLAFNDLMRPIIEICVFLPYYTVKGYLTTAETYTYPVLIAWGSGTLLFVTVCICYYYRERILRSCVGRFIVNLIILCNEYNQILIQVVVYGIVIIGLLFRLWYYLMYDF